MTDDPPHRHDAPQRDGDERQRRVELATEFDVARPRTTRRGALAAGASAALGGLAGCLGGIVGGDGPSFDEGDPPELDQVEDPPDVVYVPSHREGMAHLEPVQAGEYVLGPMVTYAHAFWTVTDDDVNDVEVSPDDDVHLMATVWDAETETVLPTDEGLTMRVRKDGELVDERAPWPMLSQTMGFHFGDNVPLDGDGTYEVEVEIPSPGARTTGAFEDRFESFETATFSFTYDQELRDSLIEGIDRVDQEHWGVPGALEPGHGGMGGDMDGMDGDEGDGEMDGDHDGTDGGEMGDGGMGGEHDDGMGGDHEGMDGEHHAMPVSSLPEPEALPGEHQGTPTTGDADFVVCVVEDFHGRSPYLLVSARTPYNDIPLPSMSLSASVARDGTAVVSDVGLRATLDDAAGFHYGAELSDLEPGDVVTISTDAPPQTARHQGYETAFVEMPDVEVTIEGW